jgi:hypothetical protein
MKKIILSLAVLIFLVGAILYALNQPISSEQPELLVGETVSVSGTITLIDMSAAMYDGPYQITILPEAGKPVTIDVPSMGLPLCPAYTAKNMIDVSNLSVGERIEARGTVSAEKRLVPCESATHYLRQSVPKGAFNADSADPANQ